MTVELLCDTCRTTTAREPASDGFVACSTCGRTVTADGQAIEAAPGRLADAANLGVRLNEAGWQNRLLDDRRPASGRARRRCSTVFSPSVPLRETLW